MERLKFLLIIKKGVEKNFEELIFEYEKKLNNFYLLSKGEKMIKKISLNKRNNKIIGGYILIPSNISKELGWFDNIEDIHLKYKNNQLIISSTTEDKESKNIEDGKLIIFNKDTKIIRGRKYYKDSVYLTEKIYLPISITKELSKDFFNLNISIKIKNNNIIVEGTNE